MLTIYSQMRSNIRKSRCACVCMRVCTKKIYGKRNVSNGRFEIHVRIIGVFSNVCEQGRDDDDGNECSNSNI